MKILLIILAIIIPASIGFLFFAIDLDDKSHLTHGTSTYEEYFRHHVSTTCPVIEKPDNARSFNPDTCQWNVDSLEIDRRRIQSSNQGLTYPDFYHEDIKIRNYNSFDATCKIDGKPDGQCFIDAFENCEYATIKNDHPTIEGDPIFTFMTIKPEPQCLILYEHDNSLDKFAGNDKGYHQFKCYDVKFDPSGKRLLLSCLDEDGKIGFYLSSFNDKKKSEKIPCYGGPGMHLDEFCKEYHPHQIETVKHYNTHSDSTAIEYTPHSIYNVLTFELPEATGVWRLLVNGIEITDSKRIVIDGNKMQIINHEPIKKVLVYVSHDIDYDLPICSSEPNFGKCRDLTQAEIFEGINLGHAENLQDRYPLLCTGLDGKILDDKCKIILSEPVPMKCKSGPPPLEDNWFYDQEECEWIKKAPIGRIIHFNIFKNPTNQEMMNFCLSKGTILIEPGFCKSMEIPHTEIDQLAKVYDYCYGRANSDIGEKYFDAPWNGNDILFEYNNGTHTIDNNTCFFTPNKQLKNVQKIDLII